MKSIFTFLLFLIFSYSSISQDLIIKKDSTKILCNILQADSLIIHYQTYKDGKSNFDVIDRKDVLKFYLANPEKLNDPKQIKVIGEKRKKFTLKKSNEILNFGILGGLAKPIGDFGNVSIRDTYSGNAKSGAVIGLQTTFKLLPFLGFKIVYFNQTNNFDNKEEVMEYYRSDIDIKVTYESEPWKQNAILGGFNFSLPVYGSNKLFLEFNTLAGFSFIKSYNLNLKYEYSITQFAQSEGITYNSSKDNSLLLNFGLGFRYKITKEFSLSTEIDYWMTNYDAYINLTGYYYNEYYGYNSYSGLTSRNYTIRTINFKIGLFYTLNKKENNKIPQ